MQKSIRAILFWAPRILTIFYAAFISLFALDVFDGDPSFWRTITALIIHLVPTFIIIIFLVLAWRWEWIGAAGYFAFGILYIVIAFGRFPLLTYLIISGPMFLVGILFLINWIFRENIKQVKK